jgi:S1-C subfamily serine protease
MFADADLRRLRKAKRELSRSFLPPPVESSPLAAMIPMASPRPEHNVVGVGIGEKVVLGVATGLLAIKILVRVKYPDNEIPAEDRLPATIDGLPVDVEQTGTFRRFAKATSMPDPRTRYRPARPGSSIGFDDPQHLFRMAGTFGAVVTKGGRAYILSNNHVLANEDKLPLKSPIFQPGLLDGGIAPGDRVATLTKFVPLSATKPNKVDCAIALADRDSLLSKEILFIGAPKGTADATIDMDVHKFGRTSGYRVGRVTSIETDVTVGYEIGSIQFTNQIIIIGRNGQPFSAAGDSGSLILERTTNRAVGLLFAGSTSHTIANHISDVLKALGVTLA